MDEDLKAVTRRHFFRQSGFGIGSAALASLLNPSLFASPRKPHFAPKAKRIIYLFMMGAPSQLDLFEDKPKLRELHDQSVPEEWMKKQRFAFLRGRPKLLASPYGFGRHGKSGTEISTLLPHLASMVDEVAFVKSMRTDHFNHGPAQVFANTGSQIVGRPSMGSWLTYGLGSETDELPGFVVLVSGKIDPGAGKSCWSSGFLPTTYQGVEFRTKGDPVPCVSNPSGVSPEARRRSMETLLALNRKRLAEVGDPEIAARIEAYEMGYRMQMSVPELSDISKEPKWVHEMYGTEPGKSSFANNCLLARRMIERGVRFVQLYHRGWDHHGSNKSDDLMHGLPNMCAQTDRAAAALVRDLKQRGLLDETLVVWGGEFGRTPMYENRQKGKFLGRDHHPRAFTMWLAGGGVKAGAVIGKTDELGFDVVEDPVHVHDLHATVLHLMGFDHERLIFPYQGLDYRLTGVAGEVVRKLLA